MSESTSAVAQPERSALSGLRAALGPGLLFAAASVGVSHVVQSTRAGAVYGLGLIGFVILANVVKYPAFRFGQQYAAATGTSLLEGYRRQGTWALWLYAGLTLLTMFTVQAAVTVVTAGLAMAMLGLDPGLFGGPAQAAVAVSVALTTICAGILRAGQYRMLDRVTKGLVLVFAISTLLATLFVLPRIDWSQPMMLGLGDIDPKTLFFIVALVGWMPSAIDIAVWQSLWTLARRHDTSHAPTVKESMIDFHIGYIGTAFYAVCFVLMGAGVMYGTGKEFPEAAGAFAAQVIGLYTAALGPWSRPLIAVSAFAVMFSTTLTVVDGFPRAIATLFARFRGEETGGLFEMGEYEVRRVYWIAIAALGLGSMLVLGVFLSSLKVMVDLATTLSFVTAPLLAWLNHRAMLGAEVPDAGRPKPWLVAMSLGGVVCLGGFALLYVYVRFIGG